jgi:hypothetical protein
MEKYFKFIEDCKSKNPLEYHIHHIIPRYMNGTNDKVNLIKLSYEDHYFAHIILADCFPSGSYHYNRNIWAALKLSSWVTDLTLRDRLSNIRKGKTYEELFGEETAKIAKEKLKSHWKKYWNDPINKERKSNFMLNSNPMKGLNLSKERKSKISESSKSWWKSLSEEDLSIIKERQSLISKSFWNSLYENEDKLKSYKEKMSESLKTWWDNADEEIIKIRNEKISNSQKGKKIKPSTIEKWKKTIKEKESFQGEKNPMFGKSHSDEARMKISNKKKGIAVNIPPRATYKFFHNNEFVYEAIGQKDAKDFCISKNISFQTLCKKSDVWKDWKCVRNKNK